MSSRSLYRRHSAQFKLPLCTDIRNGKIGRREARRTDQISANLIQLWLSQYDRGELNAEEATATTISEYEAQIAALERKVGPLTMEIDWFKKTPRRPLHTAGVSNDSTSAQYLYYRAQTQAPNLNDEPLVERIEAIQDELSGYGYRRITRALQAQGYSVNHKRIARIMKQYGLGIKPKRRFVRTTDSQHDWPIFPNLYCNQVPARPDQVWVADITFTVSTQDLSIWQ